jgi:hypothetical protein
MFTRMTSARTRACAQPPYIYIYNTDRLAHTNTIIQMQNTPTNTQHTDTHHTHIHTHNTPTHTIHKHTQHIQHTQLPTYTHTTTRTHTHTRCGRTREMTVTRKTVRRMMFLYPITRPPVLKVSACTCVCAPACARLRVRARVCVPACARLRVLDLKLYVCSFMRACESRLPSQPLRGSSTVSLNTNNPPPLLLLRVNHRCAGDAIL